MPWQSKAQERWGNSPAGHAALGKSGVDEWNAASKGKNLPERKGAKPTFKQKMSRAFPKGR